jgi:hypothetical protein
MKYNKKEAKDRVYKLTRNAAPLSFMLPTRNSRRYPLLWYDEDQNINRPLRYAVNQKSAFEDEQDGNAIVEPIIFESGFLRVPKNNPVLHEFLYYHPLNGKAFVEVNPEQDAASILDSINVEVDALVLARELSLDQLENVSRVLFGKDPSTTTSSELKRDVLIFAKRNPRGFINAVNDPSLKLQSNVRNFFTQKLLTFRNGKKEVWFSTDSNKKKMLSVPYGEDPYDMVSNYLKSDEGLDALKMLESYSES